MLKQIIFVVCLIILILAGLRVFGYMGGGLGIVSDKIGGISDMISSSMNQINGITSMTNNIPADPSAVTNIDDPMKYAENLDFLSEFENGGIGNMVKNLFGLK